MDKSRQKTRQHAGTQDVTSHTRHVGPELQLGLEPKLRVEGEPSVYVNDLAVQKVWRSQRKQQPRNVANEQAKTMKYAKHVQTIWS